MSDREPVGNGTPDILPCTTRDLDTANAIIAEGVSGWNLTERVKRLSLPLYQYDAADLKHLTIVLAIRNGVPAGVAAWEPAPPGQIPDGVHALLLHGLYVRRDMQRQGIGSALLCACRASAREQRLQGALIKAQADAAGFFDARGLQRLPVQQWDRDYELRYWLPARDPSPRATGRSSAGSPHSDQEPS